MVLLSLHDQLLVFVLQYLQLLGYFFSVPDHPVVLLSFHDQLLVFVLQCLQLLGYSFQYWYLIILWCSSLSMISC